MMRRAVSISMTVWLCALLGAAPRALSQDSVTTARALLLKGRYAEAAERFAAAADNDVAAAIGLAQTKLVTGKRADARAVLEAAAERFPKSAAIRAELAQLAIARGEYAAASESTAAALALDRDCVVARWCQAELLRLAGKLDEAQTAYGWFIGYYNRAPRIEDPAVLLFIGRGVAEHARWTRNSRQFGRLVNDVYPAALAREANYWPAHLQSALLYLEKFNEADAATELARGLAINPSAAELHAARAELALTRFDLAAAKGAIDRALEINPELLWAYQLRADWFLADLRITEAIAALE